MTFTESACVHLIRGVEAEGYRLPKGMKGTVVSVYGGGEAYAVEFPGLEGGMAVMTLRATDLEGSANSASSASPAATASSTYYPVDCHSSRPDGTNPGNRWP